MLNSIFIHIDPHKHSGQTEQSSVHTLYKKRSIEAWAINTATLHFEFLNTHLSLKLPPPGAELRQCSALPPAVSLYGGTLWMYFPINRKMNEINK